MKDSRGRQRGFTLLELMVVLVIMSVATALVVPHLAGSLTKLSARTAAKKAAAGLRYVRSRAVAERRTFVAVFDFSAQEMRVGPSAVNSGPGATDSSTSEMRTYALNEGCRMAWAAQEDGQRVEKGGFTIIFYPTGACSGGQVVFTDEKEKRYRMVADVITGAVRISEGTDGA